MLKVKRFSLTSGKLKLANYSWNGWNIYIPIATSQDSFQVIPGQRDRGPAFGIEREYSHYELYGDICLLPTGGSIYSATHLLKVNNHWYEDGQYEYHTSTATFTGFLVTNPSNKKIRRITIGYNSAGKYAAMVYELRITKSSNKVTEVSYKNVVDGSNVTFNEVDFSTSPNYIYVKHARIQLGEFSSIEETVSAASSVVIPDDLFSNEIAISRYRIYTVDTNGSIGWASAGIIDKLLQSKDPLGLLKTYTCIQVDSTQDEKYEGWHVPLDETLTWRAQEKLADSWIKSDSNLLLYIRDWFSVSNLFTPWLSLGRELLNGNKKAALSESVNSYLSFHYGTRLTIRDTKELFYELFSTKLRDCTDTVWSMYQDTQEETLRDVENHVEVIDRYTGSRQQYQDCLLSGYQGSYEEFKANVGYLNLMLDANNSDPTAALIGSLFNSATMHSLRRVTCRHSSASAQQNGVKMSVHMKAYLLSQLENSCGIIKAIIRQWDADLSVENVVDFIPYSFCLNWVSNLGDILHRYEASKTLQCMNIQSVFKSVKWEKDCYSFAGHYLITSYHFGRTSLIPLPSCLVNKPELRLPSLQSVTDGAMLVAQRAL